MTEDQSILTFGFACGSIGTVIYASGGDTTLAKERFDLFGDGKSLAPLSVASFALKAVKCLFDVMNKFIIETNKRLSALEKKEKP